MNLIAGVIIFVIAFITGFLACGYGCLTMLTGTILIDKSKAIDICRFELNKEISGKYCLFDIKYVNGLESASKTYSIVEGGQQNG